MDSRRTTWRSCKRMWSAPHTRPCRRRRTGRNGRSNQSRSIRRCRDRRIRRDSRRGFRSRSAASIASTRRCLRLPWRNRRTRRPPPPRHREPGTPCQCTRRRNFLRPVCNRGTTSGRQDTAPHPLVHPPRPVRPSDTGPSCTSRYRSPGSSRCCSRRPGDVSYPPGNQRHSPHFRRWHRQHCPPPQCLSRYHGRWRHSPRYRLHCFHLLQARHCRLRRDRHCQERRRSHHFHRWPRRRQCHSRRRHQFRRGDRPRRHER